MGRDREASAYEAKEEMSTGGHGKVEREGKVGRGGDWRWAGNWQGLNVGLEKLVSGKGDPTLIMNKKRNEMKNK